MTRILRSVSLLLTTVLTSGILRADSYIFRIVASSEDGSFVKITTSRTSKLPLLYSPSKISRPLSQEPPNREKLPMVGGQVDPLS